MKNIVLLLKGILLYTTIIVTMLTIASIDKLYDYGYLLESILASCVLVYSCLLTINKEEFIKLTFNKANLDNV